MEETYFMPTIKCNRMYNILVSFSHKRYTFIQAKIYLWLIASEGKSYAKAIKKDQTLSTTKLVYVIEMS